MLKLYRGIIDILTERSEGLTIAFRNHIREFNDGETGENNFGVKGFWNLLLEIVYVMYVKLFVAVGVILTVTLVVPLMLEETLENSGNIPIADNPHGFVSAKVTVSKPNKTKIQTQHNPSIRFLMIF